MNKRIIDIEARRELKTTKEVMDMAVEDLASATISREQLIKENEELKTKVKHLEELLVHSSSVPDIEIKSHEEEIIRVELKRMYDLHVLKNCPLVDKDDIKKLKILVESLSIIRNGQKPKKKKEKEMTVEEALEMVSQEISS